MEGERKRLKQLFIPISLETLCYMLVVMTQYIGAGKNGVARA